MLVSFNTKKLTIPYFDIKQVWGKISRFVKI